MLDELVDLLEGAVVDEREDPFASGELPLSVLALATLRAAPLLGAADALPQVVEGGRAIL